MKKVIILMIGILLIVIKLQAEAGDFIVEGNVGIGTASPNAALDVRGSAIFNEDGGDYDFRIEGDTDPDLFKVDAGLGRVNITGGTAGTWRGGLTFVNGTDVKRTAQYGLTRTFDYDENDFGTALDVTAFRNGGLSSITGLSAVVGIVHTATPASNVAGGVAANFTFQVGQSSGSGTVNIDSVKGFNYTMNRHYNMSSALTYNVDNSYGAYYGIYDGGSSTGGVVNVTNHYGNYVSDYINTGGTKRIDITNHRGLYIENLVNSTNNTMLALGGATTGNWSIYNNSNYDNYFAGRLGIGTNTPAEKLEVAGAVKVANTASQCTSSNAGTIKFASPDFWGCNGTGWVKLNN